jgi:hypothetical protein
MAIAHATENLNDADRGSAISIRIFSNIQKRAVEYQIRQSGPITGTRKLCSCSWTTYLALRKDKSRVTAQGLLIASTGLAI